MLKQLKHCTQVPKSKFTPIPAVSEAEGEPSRLRQHLHLTAARMRLRPWAPASLPFQMHSQVAEEFPAAGRSGSRSNISEQECVGYFLFERGFFVFHLLLQLCTQGWQSNNWMLLKMSVFLWHAV